jgi:hypothetical protein
VSFAFSLLCGCEIVHGSGDVITQKRSIDQFERIVLQGEGDVEFTQTARTRVVVEAEDNLVDELITEVRGDTLLIKTRERVILDPTKPILFHVEAPELRFIKVEGAANFHARDLDNEDLRIEISGSGRLAIDNLQAQSLRTTITGSGDVRMSGQVMTQDVDISGSGEYRCKNLKSADARVNVSGSGKVEVFVKDNLEVDISGSGQVAVRGEPKTKVDVSGSGDIRTIE